MSSEKKAPVYTSVFMYAVVDPRVTPPVVRQIAPTRRAGNEKLAWEKDADQLRVRRVKLIIYGR
jgi:hypothetical protein